jgi:hypothetical protein
MNEWIYEILSLMKSGIYLRIFFIIKMKGKTILLHAHILYEIVNNEYTNFNSYR